jgi:adenylate cyclase
MLRALRVKRLEAWQKGLATAVIAIGAVAIAAVFAALPPLRGAGQAIDTALYDAFYKQRTPESQLNSNIVIIAVDRSSIDRMAARPDNSFRWPWPRQMWGMVLEYLQKSGAKAVAIDLLFEEPSNFNREFDDDSEFAKQLDDLKIPVIHAIQSSLATSRPAFAPPVTKPIRAGAVDVIEERVVRTYAGTKRVYPSLATETTRAAGFPIPAWGSGTFRLHYYGPTKLENGANTFRYVPAFDVVVAAQSPTGVAGTISPTDFKDKIVLIGATSAATFDLKSSPLSGIYPTVEAQATAIENLINNQRVVETGLPQQLAVAFIGAGLAALGSVFPRRVRLKLPISLLGVAFVFGAGYWLFVLQRNITWLPLFMPMLAAILAMVAGLTWTYIAEDRQRRILLGFLSQYVSKEVAEELSRRGEISLEGQRREMTVMFTDIAGFTSMADNMPVERLEKFINFYLSELTATLFERNATLDKFIGDAIMSFWNAPLGQSEHAELACHAALAMKRREAQLQQQFAEFGIGSIKTRIGINTGTMVVGNVGSQHKVNYTVMGDAVNLGSRLEGSNKIYGSTILVSETTVAKIKPDQFIFRKLDRLKVVGRSTALEVYELLDAAPSSEQTRRLAKTFETALAHYFELRFEQAEQILVDLIREFPDDAPSVVLLGRARAFRQNPPPDGWTGVHEAGHK